MKKPPGFHFHDFGSSVGFLSFIPLIICTIAIILLPEHYKIIAWLILIVSAVCLLFLGWVWFKKLIKKHIPFLIK